MEIDGIIRLKNGNPAVIIEKELGLIRCLVFTSNGQSRVNITEDDVLHEIKLGEKGIIEEAMKKERCEYAELQNEIEDSKKELIEINNEIDRVRSILNEIDGDDFCIDAAKYIYSHNISMSELNDLIEMRDYLIEKFDH